MAQAIPYLAFDGNCAEAMRFYEHTLGHGAKIELMLSGADTPMAAEMPKEHLNRIMHARLRFEDGSYLYAGDAPAHVPFGGMKGVMVAMHYASTADAERVFNALGEGGTVGMPFQPTFWARGFGMVTDKFGTSWAINGDQLPVSGGQ